MKFICLTLACFFTSTVFCQSEEGTGKKPPTIIIQAASYDFKTPVLIGQTSLKHVLSNGLWHSLPNNYSGIGLSYWQGITSKLDFSASINSAKMFYAFRRFRGYRYRSRLYEVDVAAQLKLLSDDHFFVPFLTAGIGGYIFSNTNGSYAPLGGGFQFNIAKKVFLYSSLQCRVPVTREAQYHFLYNFSVGIPINKKKKPAPETVIVAARRISTNTTNRLDTAPPIKMIVPKGAKDSDNDGLVDSVDKCPLVAGVQSTGGCPLPDADNDGVPDVVDACPNQAGTAENRGCPATPAVTSPGIAKDTANIRTNPTNSTVSSINRDSVIIRKKPVAAAAAVPKKNTAVQNTTKKKTVTDSTTSVTKVLTTYEIYFYSGLTILPDAAYDILDNVVNTLQQRKDLKVRIIGHADNIEFGSSALASSGKRASAVYTYLVRRGIEKQRLILISAGTANPKASNQTNVGRSQNRRVDVKLISQ
jgi:OmpA-OmpF porin, OOP family